MKKILLFIACSGLLLLASSCEKDYLETNPSDAVTEQQIYSQLASVYAALQGTTKELFAFGTNGSSRHDGYGQKSIDLQLDLMGNDMVVNTQGYGWYNRIYQYVEWSDTRSLRPCDNTWFYYYDIIKQVNKINAIIDGVADATQDDKDKIRGQALGLRAYAYYNLINLFQQTYFGNENNLGVPKYIADVTEASGRGKVQDIYDLLISDLTTAETLLNGKIRADKSEMNVDVIRGFHARVALMMHDWATAETYAHQASLGYPLMGPAEYVQIGAFSTLSNPEWMWGSSIPETEATIYASFFSHMDVNTGGYASLGSQKKITKDLYDQISGGDIRKQCWTAPGTGSDPNVDYNQVKHQVSNPGSWAADYLYMRASEMYLIEAEAMARQNKDAEAKSKLQNMISGSGRYPAYSAQSLTHDQLIDEILLQRRIELWGEGFSLSDIKRNDQGLNRPSGTDNHGGANYSPAVYTTAPLEPRFLMHIPQKEFETNSNLTAQDQNP